MISLWLLVVTVCLDLGRYVYSVDNQQGSQAILKPAPHPTEEPQQGRGPIF